MNSLKVTSNFLKDGEEKDFLKCVRLYESEEAKTFKFNSDSDVDISKCFEVKSEVQNGEKSSNRITFSLSNTGVVFSKILMVSQCKRIELFGGQTLQYLRTQTGVFLDDAGDDFSMYLVDIDFQDEFHNVVSLNFAGVQESCWIMGVYVCLQNSNTDTPPASTFDLREMNRLIGDAENLSGSAKKFKEMFETFQGSRASQMLMMPLACQSKAQFPTHSSFKVDGGIGELLNGLNVLAENQQSKKTCGTYELDVQSCSNCSQNIKRMEERIMKRLDQMEKQNQDRLDEILNYLKLGSKT